MLTNLCSTRARGSTPPCPNSETPKTEPESWFEALGSCTFPLFGPHPAISHDWSDANPDFSQLRIRARAGGRVPGRLASTKTQFLQWGKRRDRLIRIRLGVSYFEGTNYGVVVEGNRKNTIHFGGSPFCDKPQVYVQTGSIEHE